MLVTADLNQKKAPTMLFLEQEEEEQTQTVTEEIKMSSWSII